MTTWHFLLTLFSCFLSIGNGFTSCEQLAHRGSSHRERNGHLSAEQDCKCSRRDFISTVTYTVAIAFVSSTPANANDEYLTNTLVGNEEIRNEPKPNHLSSSSHIQTPYKSDTTTLQESISGFISGTVVSTVKTVVKYPLDTATVRLQMPGLKYTIQNLPELFNGSFDGISGPLLSNIPAGAIFFAVKDAVKSTMKGLGLPKWASTSLAVAAALPPYWLIRNPSEVIKTRLQVGVNGYNNMNMIDAFKFTLSEGNVTSLFQGYPENVIYGFPADVIKFIVYDYLSGGKKDLSPANGAIFGAVSTGVAQFVTTPLDVARNRIMVDVSNNDDGRPKEQYMERLVRIANEEGVEALFAGTAPRIAKAMLSGALQFAAYEETKQKITEMIVRR